MPVAVETLTGVTAIAAGANHGLALLSGGTVMAWGDDSFGELGNGTIKRRETTPVAVSGLSGVTTISAGNQDSVALLGSGSVMTWGTNASGVLGDGVSGGMSDVPVTVVGLTKAASVSAGRSHMLAYGEPIPTVTSVSPRIGPAAGGATVTISGNSLTGATAVRFGAAQATSFTVNSPTSITATAPPGTGTVDVTVTTPSGTSPTGAARPLHLPAASHGHQALGQVRAGWGRDERGHNRHRIHGCQQSQLRADERGWIHGQLADLDHSRRSGRRRGHR